jgi:hypothetical protein
MHTPTPTAAAAAAAAAAGEVHTVGGSGSIPAAADAKTMAKVVQLGQQTQGGADHSLLQLLLQPAAKAVAAAAAGC